MSDDQRISQQSTDEELLYVSDRGFKQGHQIESDYGGMIRAYESSAAEGPHVWVRIECPIDLNEPQGPMTDAVVHLTLENAIKLRDQLGQITTSLENDWGVE